MKSRCRVRTLAVMGLCMLASTLTASAADAPERLGTVHFPISCSAEAQRLFNRAVALLHSFVFTETLGAFTAVAEADPDCAMAYWGLAMSHRVNPLGGPSDLRFQGGAEAVQKATAIGGATPRERDYIAATDTYWRGGDTVDHLARARAYEAAMARLHESYPDDPEAAIFYALALNEAADPSDTTYARQIKAGAILERIFERQPDHPGVAHYLIHTYDYPPLAARGLPAARRYAVIAPSSAHALHMPSHVFSMLGYWQDSIESNLASVAVSKQYSAKYLGGAATWLHSWDFMIYAHLQMAQDLAAKRIVDDRSQIAPKAVPDRMAYFTAYAAIPARYAIERGQWAEAKALEVAATTYPYVDAITAFARGLGAARSGDLMLARREQERLRDLGSRLVEAKERYWAGQTQILGLAVAAWVARAEGRNVEALEGMRTAADQEDASVKHIAMENRLVPMRELLGELLVETGDPTAALREFEHSLRNAPNRFRSFYGAAKAAERAGDLTTARAFYERLVVLCDRADADRPELADVRARLANR